MPPYFFFSFAPPLLPPASFQSPNPIFVSSVLHSLILSLSESFLSFAIAGNKVGPEFTEYFFEVTLY